MGTSKYSEEFKAQAMALVTEKGRTPKQVAQKLGITDKSVREWVQRYTESYNGEYLRIQ